MNYTWDINNIDVIQNETQTNVIRSFEWSITAELETETATISRVFYTSAGLEQETVDNFTEFNSLTKDQCVSWVEDAMGIELESIKQELAVKVKQQILNSSKNIVAAPW